MWKYYLYYVHVGNMFLRPAKVKINIDNQ